LIIVFIFADLLIFADSANRKSADFSDLLKSAKNENPALKRAFNDFTVTVFEFSLVPRVLNDDLLMEKSLY
jgi:hypothetical protein